jgi:hypothetical protein
MAWRLLKNVSSSDDYGDVSTSLDDEERMKVEAIKRKNAEARKRLENPSYNVPPFRQRDSSKRAKMRHNSNEKDPESPVEIANIMDSPERMQRLNPNVNFADGSAPPVPQNNPNPLDLSMESLKRVNEGR